MKIYDVHMSSHMIIWDFGNTAHHLQIVHRGSLSCNQFHFTTLSLFYSLSLCLECTVV